MKFYAAKNRCGSSSSYGFANTWEVLVFSSKSARDNYVNESKNITTQAIYRSQATGFIDESPKPFSYECYVIRYSDGFSYKHCQTEGLIGFLDTADCSGYCDDIHFERFHN